MIIIIKTNKQTKKTLHLALYDLYDCCHQAKYFSCNQNNRHLTQITVNYIYINTVHCFVLGKYKGK